MSFLSWILRLEILPFSEQFFSRSIIFWLNFTLIFIVINSVFLIFNVIIINNLHLLWTEISWRINFLISWGSIQFLIWNFFLNFWWKILWKNMNKIHIHKIIFLNNQTGNFLTRNRKHIDLIINFQFGKNYRGKESLLSTIPFDKWSSIWTCLTNQFLVFESPNENSAIQTLKTNKSHISIIRRNDGFIDIVLTDQIIWL